MAEAAPVAERVEAAQAAEISLGSVEIYPETPFPLILHLEFTELRTFYFLF